MPSQEEYLDNLLKGIETENTETEVTKEPKMTGTEEETAKAPETPEPVEESGTQVDMSDMDDLLQSALDAQKADSSEQETEASQPVAENTAILPEETASMSEDEINRLLQQSQEQSGDAPAQESNDANDDLIKMLENADDEGLSNILDQVTPETAQPEETAEREEDNGKRGKKKKEKKNKQIIIKKEQTIKDYKQKIIELNEVITSLKYSTKNNIDYSIKSLNEDNSNTWKNKYEELNKKYIQTHDEVIYLRRTYDKEHAKLILLENELEIAHKKIIELQKNNLQKYRKEDIENINDWRKFEQFIAKQFNVKNFKVILTPRTNDGGKDIIIEKNSIKTYIECKYWNSNKTIGREEIQKLAGAAMMDGVKNAIFITTSTYNENALETARALNKNGFNINLWTTKDLLAFINK